MEKSGQLKIDSFECASNFLVDCDEQIAILNKQIRDLLRTNDHREYMKLLEIKALYVGSLFEQANIQKACGLEISDGVLHDLEVLSNHALDMLDADDYHGIQRMLIKKPRDHSHSHIRNSGHFLEDIIYKQKQTE